jgi:hypothetical protein
VTSSHPRGTHAIARDPRANWLAGAGLRVDSRLQCQTAASLGSTSPNVRATVWLRATLAPMARSFGEAGGYCHRMPAPFRASGSAPARQAPALQWLTARQIASPNSSRPEYEANQGQDGGAACRSAASTGSGRRMPSPRSGTRCPWSSWDHPPRPVLGAPTTGSSRPDRRPRLEGRPELRCCADCRTPGRTHLR